MALEQYLKTQFRNAIRRRGWDLVRGPNLIDFLRSRRVDLVFDVGANDGGYATQIRRWGYGGEILSLEPTADAFGKMRAQAQADARWTPRKLAAGSKPGCAEINVSRNTKFNSFMPPSSLAKDFDRNMEVLATERVEVVTLDSLLDGLACERPFLKIDTQGFEHEVLEGSHDLLQRCVGVQLELPIEHIYEGVWSFEAGLAYMRQRGFTVAQMTPVTPITSDRASVLEFDCVFRRC